MWRAKYKSFEKKSKRFVDASSFSFHFGSNDNSNHKFVTKNASDLIYILFYR